MQAWVACSQVVHRLEMFSLIICCAVLRYGYMEVVRQDETFVRELLGRVLHLLYKTLQERASRMPTLVKDLGLPSTFELPVSFISSALYGLTVTGRITDFNSCRLPSLARIHSMSCGADFPACCNYGKPAACCKQGLGAYQTCFG